VGQRRERRLQRARYYRVGIAVGVCVAVLSGAIAIFATSMDNGEAAAGTSAAAPGRKDAQPERAAGLSRVRTIVKAERTKAPVNPRYTLPPADSGTGRRVVYCNHCQRVWLVEADGWVYASYAVSGRRNYPRNGTYKVIRRINPGWSKTLRLPYFVGFTYGNTTDVGFHGIPLEPDGSPIQSESQLGTPRSHGCVRQSQATAHIMWNWASMGTTVVVLA
jgi:lipoprotein-anchoring transpeptidase ErfK/SrfK